MQFVVARAPHLPDELFASLDQHGLSIVTIEKATDDVLAAADVALVASGTVTVQAALHECPMVVVYRLSPLTYRLGRPFVHVDTFAMANLVAGAEVVPELIQDDFTPEAVADHAVAHPRGSPPRGRHARRVEDGEGQARDPGREPSRRRGRDGRRGTASARSVWGRLLTWVA